MAAQGPMACPIDGTTLVMSERQGIEIDYCPSRRRADCHRRTGFPHPARRFRTGHPAHRRLS